MLVFMFLQVEIKDMDLGVEFDSQTKQGFD